MQFTLKIERWNPETEQGGLQEFTVEAPETSTLLDVLDVVKDEVDGSLADLRALRLRSLPVLGYPYGEYDDSVISHVREAGFRAAFTIASGVVDAHAVNRFAVPRIEILRRDTGLRFLWKIMFAGRKHV